MFRFSSPRRDCDWLFSRNKEECWVLEEERVDGDKKFHGHAGPCRDYIRVEREREEVVW